jgi:hypothetical protein
MHKSNRARIVEEMRHMKRVNTECQELLRPVMRRENLQARVVFYPGDLPEDEEYNENEI